MKVWSGMSVGHLRCDLAARSWWALVLLRVLPTLVLVTNANSLIRRPPPHSARYSSYDAARPATLAVNEETKCDEVLDTRSPERRGSILCFRGHSLQEAGLLPCQHYHGGPLDPSIQKDRRKIVLDLTGGNLSKSSQVLVENRKNLTRDQQLRLNSKIVAEARASLPVNARQHLHVLYRDECIVAVHKPSGILCVPGPRRNPSLANLVHSTFNLDYEVDKMVVHRLDMDTSGVVIYALDEDTLRQLHRDFRERDGRVKKTYEALVCGHVPVAEGEIDMPLERDPTRPPFMRVATAGSKTSLDAMGARFSHEGFRKKIEQAPKASLTTFRVLSWEYLKQGLPVTRVELTPHTGRTHQLRVHCAFLGHPIVGDDIYGYGGEGDMHVGFSESTMKQAFPSKAPLPLQKDIACLEMSLCLHAKQLCFYHPQSNAPIIVSADANF